MLIAKNRVDAGFEKGTYRSVLLARNQFEGLTTESARKPDTESDVWEECVDIACNLDSYENSIGNRKNFLPNYPTSSTATDIMQIGGHYFFNW
jgi:hypothetical protein